MARKWARGAQGTWAHAGAFSFFANKIVTTGEGGMLTTNDRELAARFRKLRDHAMPPERRYWHDEVGFNYRMTNLQAAVGLAQMERIDEFVSRKRHDRGTIYGAVCAVRGIDACPWSGPDTRTYTGCIRL